MGADGRPLPSAREVSNTIFTRGKNNEDKENKKDISVLFMQMGQFIDHDITHSPATAPEEPCCLKDSRGRDWSYPDEEYLEANPECFPIEIPQNDPFWKGRRTCMTFSRGDAQLNIPFCSPKEGRNPNNAITHWLDASNVYGSTSKEVTEVRNTQDRLHLLKSVKPRDHVGRELLPQCSREITDNIEACEEVCEKKARKCAFAGDFRVNEQPGLSSMHTIWVREHNRIARQLEKLTNWDLEQVFQETRRIVVAEWQMIVYNEWLPIVIGNRFMTSFNLHPLKPGQGYSEDYDASIDPRINAEFSGAAFRFGHSMVPSLMSIMNPSTRQTTDELELKDTFNDPSRLQEQSFVDGMVLGQSLSAAPAWDEEFSDNLVNHLFEVTPEGGLDLTALNIQRGRDLGLQGYTNYRKICSSGAYQAASSFNELTRGGYLSDEDVQKLQSLYRDVNDLDLFAVGVLETPHRNALLGPAFVCIIGDQFARFKKGDRFWFENGNDPETRFTPEQLDSIRGASMARIICDNTDIKKMQPFAFRMNVSVNEDLSCNNINMPEIDLNLWVEK